MSPNHFLTVYLIETLKLFRRLTSTLGLSLCALFGVLGAVGAKLVNWGLIEPAATYAAEQSATGGAPLALQAELLGADEAMAAAFGFRGFFFLPILLFTMAGLSFAGEHANRSIREYALRPVPRPALILSRWMALGSWVFVAALITFVLSLGLGLVAVGEVQDWTAAFKNLGTALVTDMAFVTLALSVAVFTRSIAATIGLLVVVFVLQLTASVGLNIMSNETFQGLIVQMMPPQFTFIENTFWVADYAVLGQPPLLWGSCGPGTAWQGYLTLFVISGGSLIAALWRFQRMDLP